MVEHHELQLDPSKLDMLLALVQSNEEGQVCYQELIELVSARTNRLTNVHVFRMPRHFDCCRPMFLQTCLFMLDRRKVRELIGADPAGQN